jgi:hypothetical protein
MPSKRAFGIKSLREAVRGRVDETSIRAVAEEIGMSPSGLHVFLKGSDPHPGTREKLVAWYVEFRKSPRSPRDVAKADVDAAIRLLVRYVQQDSRPQAQNQRHEEIVNTLSHRITARSKSG